MKISEVVSGIFPYIDPNKWRSKTIFCFEDFDQESECFNGGYLSIKKYDRASVSFGTKYSRMDHVKFVEDSP